ncbi:phage tail protein, partial [Salmonella enterica]|nr:phage tail protein [Salmonella enterica]
MYRELSFFCSYLFYVIVGLQETINKANNAVPATRRVNSKLLTSDITLWASDV